MNSPEYIPAPHWLMLGSAARNVGKTEFACALIRRLLPREHVIAVKVTTVHEPDRDGALAGETSSPCGHLDRDFVLTEEIAVGSGKDTARLKEAGAQRVFWLRVRRHHLRAGLEALRRALPPQACVICESNSARLGVEPGGFLVIREREATAIKPSCADVIEHADRQVFFHGDGWDFSPDRCQFADGQWTIPLPASAVILAGGQSRRMATDKSLLPVAGRPLVEHIAGQLRPLVDEVFLGANDPGKYAFLGLPVIPDEEPGQGPLMGLLSCLSAAHTDRVFVTACDIPTLPRDFVRGILKRSALAEVVVPQHDNGHHEPLLAAYSRRLIPVLRGLLADGKRRLVDILEVPGIRVDRVPMPKGEWYRNLNTPEDYQNLTKP